MTGLLLDMAGVLLMFFYGISPLIDAQGHQVITTSTIKESEKRKAKKYNRLSRVVLLLVFLGFSFQFVSYLIKNCNS
jgi:hypothetical protein